MGPCAKPAQLNRRRSNPPPAHQVSRAGNRTAVAEARRTEAGRPSAGEAFAALLTATKDPLWTLREENYEPALEHEVESRFAISNGFLGARASLEQPTRASRPRAYVAGFFGAGVGGATARAVAPGEDGARIGIGLG